MTATADETAAAVAYVTGQFPPLPPAYGPWLVELARRARAGEDPDTPVPVPLDIVATGPVPPRAAPDAHGTLTLTLAQALAALRQEDLLYPEDTGGIELVTPVVALTLANTADAATVAAEYNPDTVLELSVSLMGGDWTIYPDQPIHVDEMGRLANGLNTLLAIVAADTTAPVAIAYGYDESNRPLNWRRPTREA